MTFCMNCSTKETCTEARREDETPYPVWFGVILNRMRWKTLNLFLFSCWTYQYPCVDVQDLTEEPNRTVFQEDASMSFPKPGVKFHDFSRPGKRKLNSVTFPGFPWLDTPCFYLEWPPPVQVQWVQWFLQLPQLPPSLLLLPRIHQISNLIKYFYSAHPKSRILSENQAGS